MDINQYKYESRQAWLYHNPEEYERETLDFINRVDLI